MKLKHIKVEEAKKHINYICEVEKVYEFRIIGSHPKYKNKTTCIYFENKEESINNALIELDDQLDMSKRDGLGNYNVYLLINPAPEDFKFRSTGMVGTKNEDISHINTLFFDIDTDKADKHIMATEEEITKSREILKQMTAFTKKHGFPTPMYIFSGNGWATYSKCDIENTEENRQLIQQMYELIKKKWDQFDVKVCNPARVARLSGTLNMKGKSISPREHRYCQIKHIPDKTELVTLDNIKSIVEELNAEFPEQFKESNTEEKSTFTKSSNNKLLGDWSEDMALEFVTKLLQETSIEYETRSANGKTFFDLPRCPVTGTDANGKEISIIVDADGMIGYENMHDSGHGIGWKEVRAKLESVLPPKKTKSTLKPKDIGATVNLGSKAKTNIEKAVKEQDPKVTQYLDRMLINTKDVEFVPYKWVWDKKIPIGSLSMFYSEEDTGKSSFTFKVVGCVANGDNMPDGQPPLATGKTIWLGYEESIASDLKVKIAANDINPDDVTFIDCPKLKNEDVTFTLLKHALDKGGYRMIVIDPWASFCSSYNENSNQQIRQPLQRLKELAEKYQVAVIIINHVSKGSKTKDIKERSLGSSALSQFVRNSVYLKAEGATVYFGFGKNNKQKKVTTEKEYYYFNFGEKNLVLDGHSVTTGYINEWGKVSDGSSWSDKWGDNSSEGNTQKDCVDWLIDRLSYEFNPVPSGVLKDECLEDGFTFSTYKRAKEDCCLAKRSGFGPDGQWVVSLKPEFRLKDIDYADDSLASSEVEEIPDTIEDNVAEGMFDDTENIQEELNAADLELEFDTNEQI